MSVCFVHYIFKIYGVEYKLQTLFGLLCQDIIPPPCGSRNLSYQPHSRGRCRPPILSSPAHIPAWTHGTALSVTGELRKQQAIFDVYIQDGLCWTEHLFDFWEMQGADARVY